MVRLVIKELNNPKGHNYGLDIAGFPKVSNVDFRDKFFYQGLTEKTHPEHSKIT